MDYDIIGGLSYDKSGKCDHSREFYFNCRDCGRPIKIKMGCGNRFASFCKPCSRKWQQRTRFRYFQGACAMRSPKFLTLTLKKTTGSVSKRLMSLWTMRKQLFEYLVRMGYKIRSWCGVIEPPNHVHLIVDCDYIPQAEISALWRKITGDSFIVDIRSINVVGDPRQVFSYITKYMSKASNWDGCNLSMLKGFHLIASRALKLPAKLARSLCVCGSLKPLSRMDKIDFDSLFPDWISWMMRDGGPWALAAENTAYAPKK